jgi:putative transposase
MGTGVQVKAFLGRPLEHARFPYVYLDATYLHGRLGRNLQVVSRAVVVAIGINALGYREVLGIAVGDSEAEGFWRQFLGSLKERGLTGTRLVISDAHLGLTAAIKRMFQGSSWQRCRVHFLRNLLSHVPKVGQDMVAAAMKAVFVIQKPEQVRAHWQQVTEMLRKQFPGAVPVMEAARDDVLAFLCFPQEHWRKIWSTNPLERLNKEIKRRTNVVGIFPNDPAIVRLVGSQLLEQQEEWQLERRRFFSETTMGKIPEPEDALELTDGDPGEAAAAAIS